MRATAIGAIAGALLASLMLLFSHPYSVTVTQSNEQFTRAEFFYSADDGGFHATRRINWTQHPGESQAPTLQGQTLRPLDRVRFDPSEQVGDEIRFGPVGIKTRWGSKTWAGAALRDAMAPSLHQVEITGIQGDAVMLRATGTDPHFHVLSPQALRWPPLSFIGAVLLGALVIGGGLGWGLQKAGLPAGASVPLLLCAALTWHASGHITERNIYGDGMDNVRMAYSFADAGTLSLDAGRAEPRPSSLREPIPALVAGSYLWLASQVKPLPAASEFQYGPEARWLKQSHLLWVALGLLGVWYLTATLTQTTWAPVLATGLAYLYFFGTPERLDTFYTELQAGTLMVWSAAAFYRVIQHRSIGAAAVAGLLLGLLVLTKSIMLFVGLVAVPMLVLFLFTQSGGRRWAPALAVMLGAVIVVAPWMMRNAMVAETGNLNPRASGVLYGRSMMNTMTPDEIKGAFYLYGPEIYQFRVAGTDWAPIDNDFERGGRWQRLNRYHSSFAGSDMAAAQAGRPEDAISFHRTIGAEFNRRTAELRAAGHPTPALVVNAELQAEGLRNIFRYWDRHLLVSVPIFWRGFWSLPSAELPAFSVQRQVTLGEWLNLVAGLAFWALFLIALLRWRTAQLAWLLLPAGTFLAYALLTHGLPRYTAPVHPLVLIALVVLLAQIAAALGAGGRGGSSDKAGVVDRSDRFGLK